MKRILATCLLFAVPFLTMAVAQSTVDTIYTEDSPEEGLTKGAHLTDEFSRRDFKMNERIGKKAMPFDVLDSEGRAHRSSDYAGKVLILYFWNVWDWDSCEKLTLELNRIYNKYAYRDVRVLSFVRETIGLDERSFLSEHPVHFPIVPNAWDFGVQYHGYQLGTPLLFFIDKQGVWRKIGKDGASLEAWVEELLAQ